MSKDTRLPAGEIQPEPEESDPVASPSTEAPDAPTDGEHYTVGAWSGLPAYRCRYCPWDTLEGPEAAEAHWAERHRDAPEEPRRVMLPILDQRGNPIVREE